jgi:hypothetical protein
MKIVSDILDGGRGFKDRVVSEVENEAIILTTPIAEPH